ncbi:hypothetical protein NDU88_007819 [Pleurodeles waltl]|uniref:Uncharacterized protein n=1 Tax=Pleurodeles waltl TaxID=8319 RepID=A0AAV7PN00_PLEWA|nr:hypothetical protein NDU88_007819 [Pleurodeles waltl]
MIPLDAFSEPSGLKWVMACTSPCATWAAVCWLSATGIQGLSVADSYWSCGGGVLQPPTLEATVQHAGAQTDACGRRELWPVIPRGEQRQDASIPSKTASVRGASTKRLDARTKDCGVPRAPG